MTTINFEPLKIRRLSEIIEESIKDLILTGQLKTGDKLPTEKQISKQFGVSIVSVREALRGLEAFGVIEKRRGKEGGVFVTEPKRSAVISVISSFLTSQNFSAKDLSQVRKIVEPATAAIAASRITSKELEMLEKNIRRCENKIKKAEHAISERDFFDTKERNLEFHRLIAEATHNPVLALVVDYTMDFLLSFEKSILTAKVGISVKSIEEHRSILACIQRHDAQRAGEEMLSHIQRVEDELAKEETQIGNAESK